MMVLGGRPHGEDHGGGHPRSPTISSISRDNRNRQREARRTMTENAATTTDDTTDPARQAIRRRVVNRQSRPAPKEKVDVNPDIVLSDMLPLCGSLGQNPELRFTPGGRAVCNLNVAYDVRDRVGTGENTKWVSKGTM